MEDSKSYYDVLEVDTNCSMKDINLAYQRAKNAYSGDNLALYSIMTREECRKTLDSIDQAYNILSDPMKRAEYDRMQGLNQGNPTIYYGTTVEIKKEEPIDLSSGSITKMVAKNRFALAFEENPEMEQEIINCTEYTGAFLKRIREYKNVDLVRLAEMTRVSKTQLQAIEDENLKSLPAAVYTRGFVYQYAKCLRLNPDVVATSYMNTVAKPKKK